MAGFKTIAAGAPGPTLLSLGGTLRPARRSAAVSPMMGDLILFDQRYKTDEDADDMTVFVFE